MPRDLLLTLAGCLGVAGAARIHNAGRWIDRIRAELDNRIRAELDNRPTTTDAPKGNDR